MIFAPVSLKYLQELVYWKGFTSWRNTLVFYGAVVRTPATYLRNTCYYDVVIRVCCYTFCSVLIAAVILSFPDNVSIWIIFYGAVVRRTAAYNRITCYYDVVIRVCCYTVCSGIIAAVILSFPDNVSIWIIFYGAISNFATYNRITCYYDVVIRVCCYTVCKVIKAAIVLLFQIMFPFGSYFMVQYLILPPILE